MDQHPIPRQITTFEFKLIGFLTIKQFIYLVIFVGIGLAVYGLVPIPFLNIVLGVLTGSIGLAFAFIPINDRPMEVWIRNLIKRLTSPTQYSFQKHNKPVSFLQNTNIGADPSQVASHIDSQNKLNNYLVSKNSGVSTSTTKKQAINDMLINPLSFLTKKKSGQKQSNNQKAAENQPQAVKPPKQPFLTGTVKNHNLTPLGGMLIYVKKGPESETLRILKSNLHGIFQSYNPIPSGDYFFETKDPKQGYFFDTIKVRLENSDNKPIEIHSKELI